MAVIRAFRAVRPAEDMAEQVAALPYDVYSREEAAEYVKNRPFSFLNIDRPETAFPPVQDMYADEVYDHGADLYRKWKDEGIFISEKQPCLYVYELTMDGRTQTGLCALSSVDDYLDGVCKKHENTTAEKEADRIRHVDALSAQTGPIFLSYHHSPEISEIINREKEQKPLYDVTGEDGVRHRIFIINDPEVIKKLVNLFSHIGYTYIADGHHRAASAVKAALKRRKAADGINNDEKCGKDCIDNNSIDNNRNSDKGSRDKHACPASDNEYDYFLSVLFPDDELKIYDYNRVVKDLNGLTKDEFLKNLGEKFEISECMHDTDPGVMRPHEKYEYGMYTGGKYYILKFKKELIPEIASDPVRSLDVSVLQDNVLSPLLGIKDPRTDKRIKFVGGIRGLKELKKDVDEADSKKTEEEISGTGPAVAFALYPTSMEELFRVADKGMLMPPKSTWFEPKLKSGFLIHEF